MLQAGGTPDDKTMVELIALAVLAISPAQGWIGAPTPTVDPRSQTYHLFYQCNPSAPQPGPQV